ncbi:MAG: hypothetical protein Q8P41_25905 [Pseudomonadota bacterium]|nr:hypothetical protein [Pseudomonadota bacterium]
MEPLPDLHTSDLDPAAFGALFDDLERHAEVLDVLVKGDAARRASDVPVPLREAQAMLAAGLVRGVQIRYRWDGAEWRDTLMRAPLAIRIVRMRMPPV